MSDHYRLLGPALTVQVLGEPVGQGRISTFGKGRTTHSNAKRLLPWREQVQNAAEAAIEKEQGVWHRFPLTGPVGLYCCFTVRKPASAPKTRTTWPAKRPDGSHLIRAVEDALQNAGAFIDDSQVVDGQYVKVFPGEHVQALHVPGVVIRVYTVGEATP